MGLTLDVGYLSRLKSDDTVRYRQFREKFDDLNRVLQEYGIPAHNEPENMESGREFSCTMWNYSGLHYLRRIAAHIALNGKIPDPGCSRAPEDPVLIEYFRKSVENENLPYIHLIVHCDAEGFYIPVKFTPPLFDERNCSMIGSAYKLLDECLDLARKLEIPLDRDINDAAICKAVDTQGSGEEKWKRYAIETYTCLRLITACRASIESGAAICFV